MIDRPWAGRRLHLVGLGGAGMSGYARVAAQLGARVSGSDRADGPALAALREQGIDVHVGHAAGNVPAGDDVEVVHSTAIPLDNPEREAARARGLADRPRADLLEQLSRLKRTIAVAGAHGKTTTTSMIAHALLRCGLEPSYLIGGALRTTGLNADWGAGEWLVVEADESDRSMLELHVAIAVVTNVELDHHATYGSLSEVREVFRAFLAGVPDAILWNRPDVLALRDPDAPRIAFDVPAPVLEPGGSRFAWDGIDVRLAVPGAHNARNAAAALEACRLAGADPPRAAAALADFAGAGRRFERLGTTPSGAAVIDDYAHHPTEVAATIGAARTLRPRRVVAVFQPHLYSRTERLAGEFGAALAGADVAAVLDVYPARERAEDFPGVSGLRVAEAAADAARGRPVLWLPDFAAAERALRPRLRAGDLCLVLGAGNVDALGRRLVATKPEPPAGAPPPPPA
jgi:UDP-N-acetylmuramate--alanine ligase